MLSPPDRLYVVVRADLSPGAQVAQAMHAFRSFLEEHPGVERAWFQTSNTLAVLSAPNEGALQAIVMDAIDNDFRVSQFREPDMGDSLTAIALEPAAKRLVRSLPLALSPP